MSCRAAGSGYSIYGYRDGSGTGITEYGQAAGRGADGTTLGYGYDGSGYSDRR